MYLNPLFRNWLNARKITDKVIEDFQIEGDTTIVIPVTAINGQFIFNKYRRSPLSDYGPKYTYDAGGVVTLFGYYIARNEKTVLITEGELDSLVAWSAGIPAVSSTGGALSFQKEWVELLEGKEVIVCFDNDEAGGKGMAKMLDLIPTAKMMFIPDRAGVKDISDYVSNGGDLNELIKTARHFTSIEDVKEHRAERSSLWLSTWFHDAYLKNNEKPIAHIKYQKDERFGDALSRAKQYPMTSLLEFTKGKAICPFHAEKSGSLHYYPESNKAYCFGGCGKSYDAIDVYKKLNNCSFKEAVIKMQ